jgi:hypothetical protein
MIMADLIQFAGADACFDVGAYHLQNFTGKAPGNAHFCNFFRCFYID